MKTEQKKTVAEAIEDFTKSVEAMAADVREKLTDPPAATEEPATEDTTKGAKTEGEEPAATEEPATEEPAADAEKDAEIETLKARIAELEAAAPPAAEDTDKSFDIDAATAEVNAKLAEIAKAKGVDLDAADISFVISEKKKSAVPDEDPPAQEFDLDDDDPKIGLTKAFSATIFG